MSLNIDPKALISSALLDQRNDVLALRSQTGATPGAGNFSRILSSTQQNFRVNSPTSLAIPQLTVKPGDTLSNIVRNFMGERGISISQNDALRMAQDVAKASGIQNPDRIFPGQRLNVASLQAAVAQQSVSVQNAMTGASPGVSLEEIAATAAPPVHLFTKVDTQAHPIL